MILNLEEPVGTAIKNALAVKDFPELKCISHGASQVVFHVNLPVGTDANQFAKLVEKSLRQNRELKYATISVTVAPGDYETARESLVAQTRYQQSKRLRVSPAGIDPKEFDKTEATQTFPWCAIDMVRPACRKANNIRNSEKTMLGESASVRRKYGFAQKQLFYSELPDVNWKPDLGQGTKIEAAWDFQQISQFDQPARNAVANGDFAANLDGKLAVIYIDGNGFGKKQIDFCTDEANQATFDKAVQLRWRKAIKAILDEAWREGQIQDPLWWNSNDHTLRHRLETLLWGGDEVIWVVPAWFGLSTLKTVFEKLAEPDSKPPVPTVSKNRGKVPNLTPQSSKKITSTAAKNFGKLTYSAGLVFCHAEAPIQGIIQLAKDLANHCKAHLSATNSESNLCSYAVLESFDQLGEEMTRARQIHLPFPPTSTPPNPLELLLVSASKFAKLLPAIAWMQQHFPRGSMYQILRELRRPADPDPAKVRTAAAELAPFERLFERALRDVPPAAIQVANAKEHEFLRLFDLRHPAENADDCRVNWLHLAELWDYVVRSRDRQGANP